MSKQHLSILAIVAVSLIMGIPALMAEAERPIADVDDNFPPETINVGPYPEPVCDADDVSGTIEITTVVTTYQNGNQHKVVTEKTFTGDLFADAGVGDKVGELNEKITTTEDESDKGNNVDKTKRIFKINCLNGSGESKVTVDISHAKK